MIENIESETSVSNKASAFGYARNGWLIFPVYEAMPNGTCACGKADCGSIGKHPRTQHGLKEATSDLAIIERWWSQWPQANIGMRLSGLAVLDIDPRNGGIDSLSKLERMYGDLDERAVQRSGGDGLHYLFRAVEGAGPGKLPPDYPGIDILTGPGDYFLVEPSSHKSGGHYEWLYKPTPLSTHRDAIALTDPPPWLIDILKSAGVEVTSQSRKQFRLPDEINEGGRDNTLTSAAGKLRRAGFSTEEIMATMREMNQSRCKPPLPDADIRRISKSIGRKQPGSGLAPDQNVGLTKELASAITATDHFARDKGTLLYHFEGGVYRQTGERFIERRVKALCEEWGKTRAWSPELATRVEQWILADAPELWECPPLDMLNCRNGLLDVSTRILREHSPEHLSPVQIAAGFDPEALCPHIDQFVRDVFPEDSQHIFYEIAAWLMLPNTSIQKTVLLLGEGANGKSVCLNLLMNFLGRENVSALSLHRIEADKFAAARLVGKLCNIGTDLPTAALAGTSMFKALTGGDTITVERKFEASFEFRPFVRLLFSANSAPRSDDATHGFFRRWLVITFSRTFDESDPATVPRAELDGRLCQPGEWSGMLNRALDKLEVIRRGGFTESVSTKAGLDEFRKTTDPLAVWLDQNTIDLASATVAKDRLRRLYGQVCQDSGRPIMAANQFTAALMRLRPKVLPTQRRLGGKQTPVFAGLGLRHQEPWGGEGDLPLG